MYHTKNAKLSNITKEKYINVKNNKYRVKIKQIKIESYFDNLQDAILYRDLMLEVLDEYYKRKIIYKLS